MPITTIFNVTEIIKKNYEVLSKIWLKEKKCTDHPSHPSVNIQNRGRKKRPITSCNFEIKKLDGVTYKKERE